LGEHWSWRKSFVAFAILAVAFISCQRWLMNVYGEQLPFLSHALPKLDPEYNWDWFVHPHGFNHIAFANGGLLVLMFTSGWTTYRQRLFKLMAIVLLGGIAFVGTFTEPRDLYEILPLGAMMVSEAWLAQFAPQLLPEPAPSRKNWRRWKWWT
jgi:hypothetical protein